MLKTLASSLRRFGEMVAAGLLAVIFIAFILQIALRYVFNWPVGWTAELSVVAWLWLVLWGASFVLRDDEEIRIDLLHNALGKRARSAMAAIGAISIIVLFGLSLPAAYAYVSFMKVEKSSYMGLRFDFMFSIYIIFSVAVIGRNLWNLGQLLRGKGTSSVNPEQPASGL